MLYFPTFLFPDGVAVQRKSFKMKPAVITARLFSSRYPETCRHSLLGICAHFEQSIKRGKLDITKLWLANYFNLIPKESEDHCARVTAYIKIVQRAETLDQQLIDKKIEEYRRQSCGRATHIVEKVIFGAEFICCLKRNVDLKVETKMKAEDKIYSVAKAYFEQAISTDGCKWRIVNDNKGPFFRIRNYH